MSTQSQSSFTIRRADSNDGEAIVACLAVAFAPYSKLYTPAAFTDTVLDPKLVQDRLREMCVFVAVSEGNVVGTVASLADRLLPRAREGWDRFLIRKVQPSFPIARVGQTSMARCAASVSSGVSGCLKK